MSAPQDDEKVCPFCAETIKVAAVKCRFCQSDLPPVPAAHEPPPEASFDEPGTDVPEVVDGAAEGEVDETSPARGTSKVPALLVALVLAGLLFAAGSVWLVVNGLTQDDAREDGLRIGIGNQVVSTEFRDAALRSASVNAVTALSYSYKTLDADESKARAVMTADFIKEYDEVMKQASPKVLKAKLTLKATVVASSLVSIEPRRAQALLFVNAVTTAEDSPKQQLNQNRVLMTLTRKDGDWIVSKIEAF
ncbi:hypothetical protein ABIE44_000113 [Marmoricola sp. OAE513]|uniref:hypothetical protein n=1 Tax=Marmoricola sp. OAE513 TaxID=2817894 RepID=UPI001AE79FBC